MGGEQATYVNYLTHCDKTFLDDLSIQVTNRQMRKILRDGQLYIQVNQQTYDSMGRVVNR